MACVSRGSLAYRGPRGRAPRGHASIKCHAADQMVSSANRALWVRLRKHARRRSCWKLSPGHEAVPGSTAIERSGRVLSLVLLMQRIRKPLSWLVAGWLVSQLATLVAAPIVLGGSGAVHAASDDANCTCPPGTAPGLTCPMHSSPYGDAPTCRIRSTSGPSDAALLSLVGGLGVLPPSRSVPYVAPVARAVAIPPVALIGRSELPESPPPRA